MDYFVNHDSIVRQIWGKSDTILFIFAGAAAEFALNKAVDWLYFTGRLPADPLGRLFSTVSYARKIVFSPNDDALRAIDSISAIHSAVEAKRGGKIPDWAYRDVLFMLIDYSVRAFELLERRLTDEEKQDVFDVFYRVGNRMQLVGLPENYREYEVMRKSHLQSDMAHSSFTTDLFTQYRKHLGAIRYRILLESQILVVPEQVRKLLQFRNESLLGPLLAMYKVARTIRLDSLLKALILPNAYKQQIRALDIHTT
ncbi:MAG: DUF2236 domain-containing protein [Flavobacterium sp.]|nr:MAG: DUF2236 domain-containing protein [Flavobacterium sp.]